MITITRRQARSLRGIFRRSVLGITHRGIIPPLMLGAEGMQLRAHYRYAPVPTVELIVPGSFPGHETIALPFDALADFEGRAETPVTIESTAPDRTVVRWEDHLIPLCREYHVPVQEDQDDFPGAPAHWTEMPAGFLDALAEAGRTCADDAGRYALNCIQLRGETHEMIATDGRQLLVQGGFPFPWTDDVLIRESPVLSCKDLPRDEPVSIGRTETHVVLRVGTWTVFFEIKTGVRFPCVDQAIPDDQATATRLELDAQDATFLDQALESLPGAGDQFSPATIDCNGKVAVRARAADQTTVTELVLGRSRYTGSPVRFNTNRHFLARALRLGFSEFAIVSPDEPPVCRDRDRTYCWQPLSHESALEPTDDVTRIESCPPTTPAAIPPDAPPQARTTVNHRTKATRDNASTNGVTSSVPTNGVTSNVPTSAAPTHSATDSTLTNGVSTSGPPSGTPNGHAVPETPEPTSLAALIQEAEALHETLSDARVRAGRLIVSLRRYRRRERLVASTLASLRQLKLTEVGE